MGNKNVLSPFQNPDADTTSAYGKEPPQDSLWLFSVLRVLCEEGFSRPEPGQTRVLPIESIPSLQKRRGFTS